MLNSYGVILIKLKTNMCSGCFYKHPSQRNHDCVMMETEERVYGFLDDAMESVALKDVSNEVLSKYKDAVVERVMEVLTTLRGQRERILQMLLDQPL